MAIRHRVPTIFSIYMVDVLCCALGCVILLWQVNFQEAQKQTAAATVRGDDLQNSLNKLHAALQLVDETKKSRDAAEQLAIVRKKDFDALKETHELTLALLDKLRGDNKDLEAKTTLTGAELSDKIKLNSSLLLKIAAAEGRVRDLEKDLTLVGKNLDDKVLKVSEIERLASLLGKEKLELLAKLKTADLRLRILESDLTKTLGETTDAQRRIADLVREKDAMNLRMTISAKDMETLQAAMARTNAENFEAQRRAKALQAVAENRFAGITLTGKKVVFMVDMSGSMELTDENTADPDKWPFVCDTVARILASLTEVTHFQVILFSDKNSYPLANDGKWFEVGDKLKDAKNVAERLKQIKPKGATNMYGAFEEAFRFRPLGMDSIYVISDGLPNAGPGLPPDTTKLTEQTITTALSKHLRTKLKSDWNKTVPLMPRVRINTVGFFYESPDVGAFLWALAREHEGSFVGMNKP